ncbi:hypothetical protein BCV70DRAFT_99881 [Testicularia cyperi]|uniref:Uncharacterized protein n=1 Tax=Testicularia cyperi TaxID=1882483 RepID=A0A317XTP8_9BASI|nr:hypothetical protein BCV70DRAFT_99881 [Testicularia cyperi]
MTRYIMMETEMEMGVTCCCGFKCLVHHHATAFAVAHTVSLHSMHSVRVHLQVHPFWFPFCFSVCIQILESKAPQTPNHIYKPTCLKKRRRRKRSKHDTFKKSDGVHSYDSL